MISLIVSAYNVELSLKKCIDSILNQTFKDFEVIIVNDGSSDRTGEIADSYKDNRIKVIHKENGGLTSARLVGFKEANGEFFSFIDSDDYLENNYLEILYENFDEETDIVISSYYLEDKETKKIIFEKEEIEKKDFNNRFIIPSVYYCSKSDKGRIPNFVWLRLYRKNIINEDCFVSEREVYTEDLFFQFYALIKARRIKIIDKPLYHYVVNSDSLTIKYRPNKYKMLKNRHEKILEYTKNNSIDLPTNRIEGLNLSIILSSVRNSAKSDSYEIFKKDCLLIKNEYGYLLHKKPFGNQNDKIIFYLLKFGFLKLLFRILNTK